MKLGQQNRQIMARLAGAAALAAAASLAACGSPSPPRAAPAAAAAPAPESAAGALGDRNWGVVRSKALGLKLALPEARAWLEPEAPRASSGVWDLRHEPTGSSITLRRWRSARLPQLDACELELRQRAAGVPEVDETNLVATRQVRVPEGFVTRLSLLSLPGKGSLLRGQVLAIGAGVGECLAALATTECSSEDELAERLRLFDTALGHLRLSRIEDRVPTRAPLAP